MSTIRGRGALAGRFDTVIKIASSTLLFVFLVVYFLRDTRISISGQNHGKIPKSLKPISLSIEESNQVIDDLIREADEHLAKLSASETHSLADAARTYRTKRGRHPPPGFDIWYESARKSNSPMIESFFDSLYDNLEPFWSIQPQEIRDFASRWPTVIVIRNGRAERANGMHSNNSMGVGYYQDMLNHISDLPDVDLAINDGDESFVIVPFDQLSKHMEVAERTRVEHNKVPLAQMINGFPSRPALISVPDELPMTEDHIKGDQEYWDVVAKACRPSDPIFTNPDALQLKAVPPVHSKEHTMGSSRGYISNYTMARSACWNPNMRTLHGMFIKPWSGVAYTQLHPIFSVSNIVGISNDIVIPPAADWLDKSAYAGVENKIPWNKKKSATGWWGTATGGNHTAKNWWGFHRHRFVQLLNGTAQSIVEKELEESPHSSIQDLYNNNLNESEWGRYNFPYPMKNLFPELAGYGKLGPWIGNIANGGFVDMFCSMMDYWKSVGFNGSKTCDHTDAYYEVVSPVNMDQLMQYKYLPDVDGHGASGRYLGFIRSFSVPIKSTILTEWHDDRLIPWRHFVPMTPEYQEWWGLLQYFLGYSDETIKVSGHDHIGKKIGRQGSEWTARAERKEDLLVYFHRLILEYARICSDDRISMGWVDDLLGKDLAGV